MPSPARWDCPIKSAIRSGRILSANGCNVEFFDISYKLRPVVVESQTIEQGIRIAIIPHASYTPLI